METLYIIAAVVISAVMSVEAYKLQLLTRDGAACSFLVGACVGVFSSINAFFLLTVFTIAGFFATMMGIRRKEKAGLQEGNHGERTWKNVAGVGFPPCLAAVLSWLGVLDPTQFAIFFISTITVAGADTIASEIGVRDKRVYLITTFERVEPGVNGGVSRLGTGVSTVAALLIAVLGWAVIQEELDWLLLIPFAMGVLGNLLDSVFGAVFENRGRMSKYANNCSTALIGGIVGLAIYAVIRWGGLDPRRRGGAGHIFQCHRLRTSPDDDCRGDRPGDSGDAHRGTDRLDE